VAESRIPAVICTCTAPTHPRVRITVSTAQVSEPVSIYVYG
jgi:hypothetical protein